MNLLNHPRSACGHLPIAHLRPADALPTGRGLRARLEWGMIVIDTKECHQCQHYQRTRKGPHYWDLDCAMKQREFETADADSCGMYSEDPQPPADSVGFPYGDQE